MVWEGGSSSRGRSTMAGTIVIVAVLLALSVTGSNALLPGITTGGTTGTTTGLTLTGTDLFQVITNLLSGNTGLGSDVSTGVVGGVAGSLALLAAALKAPLVALYQISAEVVVMVALILFISYIASLLGIDDFRRRSGLSVDGVEEGSSDSGFIANLLDSELVQGISDRVYNAVENFDKEAFLEGLDTRY